MLSIVATMAGPVFMWANELRESVEAQADVARAERERAEEAARCARDPECSPPPMPSDLYDCRKTGTGAYACVERGVTPDRQAVSSLV
jgi:type II secretory pathway pseudopilin PulG